MSLLILSLIFVSLAQACTNSYYNYDGSCNNIAKPNAGIAEGFYRRGPEGQEPGDLPVAGPPANETYKLYSNRPNERVVSNAVIAQHAVVPNDRGLNLIAVLFGQVLTHDLSKTLRPADNRSNVNITEATDTFMFMPDGTPKTGIPPVPFSQIGVRRSGGLVVNGVFEPYNEISGYLDAHFIYGASASDNSVVRGPKVDGKLWLKTFTVDLSRVDGLTPGSQADVFSEENFLLLLTDTNFTVDISNIGENSSLIFSAGDSRVSENMVTCVLHLVWAREHNRQASLIKAQHPTWNDEQIFQKARTITIALYQNVIYSEYLPTVWGHNNYNLNVGRYRGYRPNIDGSAGITFSTAAMRVGHSTVKQDILMYTGCGAPALNLAFNGTLSQAGQPGTGPFQANPGELLGLTRGSSNILQAAIYNKAEEGDNLIADTLRNINIPSPFATGVDVSVANMRRGRIHSIANYHTLRQNYYPLLNRKIYGTPGCPATETSPSPDPLGCFTKFIESVATATSVRELYGKVNNIDAYVGILTEKKDQKDSQFGPTGTNIVLDQFRVSRDGDRFYWENLPESLLTRAEKRIVKRTTFADIIKRTSSVVTINDNAFMVPTRPDRSCTTGHH